jgi:hypothetical protein
MSSTSKRSRSHRTVKKELGSHSRGEALKNPLLSPLQTYTDRYRVTWQGKKRELIYKPIWVYNSLGSVGHIMIGEPTQLTTTGSPIETIEEPPWSKLYEKRCELEAYCGGRHGLRVPKARSAELPREDSTMILDRLERENKQMQKRLDRYHAIQKARKHLKGKAQEQAIKSINEITNLDSDKELSDYSDSGNDDFQTFLPTSLRRCC